MRLAKVIDVIIFEIDSNLLHLSFRPGSIPSWVSGIRCKRAIKLTATVKALIIELCLVQTTVVKFHR